jgi:rhodanese-related sulfurtransferase
LLVPTAPATAQQNAVDAVVEYLAEGPIEHFLLQPEALPDDPSEEFFLVFDVRTANEVGQDGMLPSARHVPYTDLASLLEILGEDRSQPALIYCHTMLRSTQVVMALRLLGYDNVWYLAGGIERWRAAGKPLRVSK